MRELWRFEGFFSSDFFLPPSLTTGQRTSGSQGDVTALKDIAFSSCRKDRDKTRGTKPAVRTNGNLSLQRGES